MKGITLVGGSGTRLYPAAKAMSKQMVPVYDRPMIYYPMSVLMLSTIKDILIISTSRDIRNFKELFGDELSLGLNIEYATQENPDGLVEAFIIGEQFIENDSVVPTLGDNIFYGQGLGGYLDRTSKLNKGAMIFEYFVHDPRAFGVVEFDDSKGVISIEEKPGYPKFKHAVPGLHFYDNTAAEKVKLLKPSKREELEITDLNRLRMREKSLKAQLFGRGMAWFDTSTHVSMLQASNFVEAIQNTQGTYIACPEEVSYRKSWISKEQVKELAEPISKTGYGEYLLDVIDEE